jgi:hypothetical protein
MYICCSQSFNSSPHSPIIHRSKFNRALQRPLAGWGCGSGSLAGHLFESASEKREKGGKAGKFRAVDDEMSHT